MSTAAPRPPSTSSPPAAASPQSTAGGNPNTRSAAPSSSASPASKAGSTVTTSSVVGSSTGSSATPSVVSGQSSTGSSAPSAAPTQSSKHAGPAKPSNLAPALAGFLSALVLICLGVGLTICFLKRRRESARRIREEQKAEVIKREMDAVRAGANMRYLNNKDTLLVRPELELALKNRYHRMKKSLDESLFEGSMRSPSASSYLLFHGPSASAVDEFSVEASELSIARAGGLHGFFPASPVGPRDRSMNFYFPPPIVLPPTHPLPAPPVQGPASYEIYPTSGNTCSVAFPVSEDAHIEGESPTHLRPPGLEGMSNEYGWPETPSIHSPMNEISPVIEPTPRLVGTCCLAAPIISNSGESVGSDHSSLLGKSYSCIGEQLVGDDISVDESTSVRQAHAHAPQYTKAQLLRSPTGWGQSETSGFLNLDRSCVQSGPSSDGEQND